MTTKEFTTQTAKQAGANVTAYIRGLITHDETVQNFSRIMDELFTCYDSTAELDDSDPNEVLRCLNTIRVISESMQGIRRG